MNERNWVLQVAVIGLASGQIATAEPGNESGIKRSGGGLPRATDKNSSAIQEDLHV